MEENETTFAGLKIRTYPLINESYLGHWRINIRPHAIYFLSLLLIYGYIHFNIAPFIENGAAVKVGSLAFTALIVYLHVLIVYLGPGYLPHDYPNHAKGTPSIAIYQRDALRASKTVLKERTQYMTNARRFVIQYITWDTISSTFIGKRNGKLYLWRALTNLIYTIYITCCAAKSITGIIYVYNFGLMTILTVIIVLASISVAVSSIIMVMKFLDTVMLNTRTAPDLFNTDFTDSRSMLANLREILGRKVVTWFLPIPAFIGTTDEELYTIHGI